MAPVRLHARCPRLAVIGAAWALVWASPAGAQPQESEPPPGDASQEAGDASREAGDASREAGDASREAGDASREEDSWGEDGDDWGEDGDDWGEGGDGWGEGETQDEFGDIFDDVDLDKEPPVSSEPPLPISMGGFARSSWGLWTERFDDNPFASGRQNLDLWLRYRQGPIRVLIEGHVEYDLAYLHQRDSYDRPTLDSYEWLVDTREAYVELTASRLQVITGRQILPLGQSNMLTPLDVLSPYDLREIGLTEVEDMRLPLLATKLAYLRGASQLEAVIVHESGFGYRSPPLGPYGQLAALGDIPVMQALRYRDLQERFAADQQELMLGWKYRGHGLDLGLYAASVLDNTGVILLPETAPPPEQEVVDIDLDHRRYTMIGHSGARPWSSWVFKWDVGVSLGQPVNVMPGGDIYALSTDDTSMLNAVLSADYSHSPSTLLTVELSKGVYLEDVDDIVWPYDAPSLALRASHRRWRDDLELTATTILSGLTLEYGWLARMSVSYRFREGLRAIAGYVTYHPSEDEFSLLSGLDSHDRLFGQLRWDFQVL